MHRFTQWFVAILILSVFLAGCAAADKTTTTTDQISDPTLNNQPETEYTVPVTTDSNPYTPGIIPPDEPETTNFHPIESSQPTIPVEETTPTEGLSPEATEDLIPEVPEDTRPPIIVEVPTETKPETDYEHYNNMTPEEQKAFIDSFDSPAAFFDWYEQAKQEYESINNDIIIDDSTNIEILP